MDSLRSSFFITNPIFPSPSNHNHYFPSNLPRKPKLFIYSSVTPDPWTLSDGNNPGKPKPKSKNAKKPLSDDNARRIIKAKAQYLSVLRRNQGPRAQTPKWIKRTPEQMVQYLEDDRNGQMYGKHVVAAIRHVRSLSQRAKGEYDMRMEMASFVGKLTFREMCVVLKEQKNWRQVMEFFAWMKLQLSFRPSVIVYTLVLRVYGQVGKIKLAEETFLEMLEVGCEPDEVACGTMLCTYARWGHHKAMLSFYAAVKERGIILSVAVFNFMLSSLQKKALHPKVIELWREMVDKGVAPNDFTYTIVISSLVKEGLHEEAFNTFSKMISTGLVPEEVTYSLLITLSSKMGNRDEALKLYEDMRNKDIVPSNYTCASLLTLFYKNEDYSKALSLFSEMHNKRIKADEVIYGLLIRIYGKLGLYEDAQKTFEEIEQLGLLTDEKTYLAMAQVHLISGNFEKALKIIDLMKSRNIWLSRFAYIVLLQCYVAKEDLKSAKDTFHALSKTGLPDAGSCSDLLNLYIRLDLIEEAKTFISQIRKEQVIFNEELYRLVMTLYCKEGMLSDIHNLIEEMGMMTDKSFKDNKFIKAFLFTSGSDVKKKLEDKLAVFEEPDTMALGLMLRLYLADGNVCKTEEILKLLLEADGGRPTATQLVSNLIREGDAFKAEALLNQLTKLGCRPDDATITSLVSLYGKQQQLQRAQEVFAAVSDSSSKKIYNAMIDAYAKCGKIEDAYLFYTQVTEKGHDLGARALSIVVNALTNAGKHHMAESVIHKSLEACTGLDTVAFNTFIKAMLEAGKLRFASSIYEHMLVSGVIPSIQTYNTMISVYGRGRNLEKATEMFNAARSSGVSLDEKAYMNLISYYGKAGKVHEASLLFTEMLEEGIRPGLVGYNIMINVYAAAGLHQQAEKLFKAMEEDGYLPDSFSYLSLIRAYTEDREYSEAEEVINYMKKRNIPLACSHYSLLLSAFTKAGLMREAERVYDQILTAGLNPDLVCNRTLMRGYMDYGFVKEGTDFFQRIYKSVEADRFIMSAGVHFYRSVGNEVEALRVLDCMDKMGISFLKDLRIGLKVVEKP